MDKEQSHEDHTSANEASMDKEKKSTENNINGDSLSQEVKHISLQVSQSESNHDFPNNKRPRLGSPSADEMEKDGNACLIKRLKLETTVSCNENKIDMSDSSSNPDSTGSTKQTLKVQESVSFSDQGQSFALPSPKSDVIQEGLKDILMETQLKWTSCIEGNVDDVTVAQDTDCSSKDSEMPADSCDVNKDTEEKNHNLAATSCLDPQGASKQVNEQVVLLNCELCSFQCLEENLLNAHYNSKMHQNLVAQRIPIQTIPKKNRSKNILSTVKRKSLKTNTGIKKIRSTSANSADPIVDLNDKKEEDSQGLALTENVPFVDSGAFTAVTKPKDQSKTAKVHKTLTARPVKSERLKNVKSMPKSIIDIQTRRKCDRSAHEKSLVFRKKHSFGQVKKQLHLMNINKKGKNEDHIVHMNHNIRARKKTLHVNSAEALQTKSINHPKELRITDRTSAFSSKRLKAEHTQKKSDRKVLRTCAYCKHVFQNRKGLEIHVKRRHTKEMQFYCQPCGYSCVTRGDFEKHCQSNRHQTGEINLACHLCTLVAPDETVFNAHMTDEHSMGFHCSFCKFYFRVKEDAAHHEIKEQHLRELEQKSSVSSTEKLTLQTAAVKSCPSENGENNVTNEIEVTIEHTPLVSEEKNKGNEVSHLEVGKPQFHCKKCFYKTRSSTVLTRHIKLRHAHDYHFLCKACNIYCMCKEGMEKHIKRSKHIENARKNHIGLLFEECIEKVWFDGIADSAISDKNMPESEVIPVPELIPQEAMPSTEESICSSQESSEIDPALANTSKRGRPKGNISRMCTYCGLLASSVTNLTVHIRRKHSHQYSYLCKVCNYYTVTKGDMERHCATKKHKSRVAEERNGQQKTEIIVTSDGTNFEDSGKKKGNITCIDNEHSNIGTNTKLVNDSRVMTQKGDILYSDNTGVQIKNSISEPQEKLQEHNTTDGNPLISSSVEIGSTKCSHCDFAAHSVSSLEMHIKRKHTKEFEYYCMACDYYAVTRREMIRHAATEKHKIKSQSHQSSSSPIVDSSVINVPTSDVDVSKEQLPEQPEECSTMYKQNLESTTIRDLPALQAQTVVLDSPTTTSTLDVKTNISDITVVNTAINSNVQSTSLNNGSIVNEDKGLNGTNIHEQSKDNIPLSSMEPSEKLHSENLDYEEKVQDVLDEKSNLEHESIALDTENLQIEESSIPVSSQQPCAEEAIIQDTDSKNNEDGTKTLVVKNDLQAQCETEACLVDNVWCINVSTENYTSEYKNTEELCSVSQNGSQFDSSIVKLKNSHGVDLTDSSEGHVANTMKGSDSDTKIPVLQSSKRRKADGNNQGETTRIRCDDCGFLADGLSGLNVHIAMKHPTKEKHFHCLLCGKSFFTESNLHQHLASVGHMKNEQASFEELPEGGASFKCVKCTERFDSEQSLFLHIKEQHEELLREVNKYIEENTEQINKEREENQGNVCKYCGKICKSSNSMAFLAHIRTHTGSKPFKCKICHFATAQLGDARNHVKRHLGMREYKCHVCGVSFVMKKHLNTHLLGKHGVGTPKERKFSCNLCDRSFREKWALNNHMKLHTGEKPFKCSWPTCHYSFLTASAMKDHYRTHTGEKSFLCDLCGFAGGTRHALTKHRRQHTGEKPFRCDECNFASTTQSHLTRHKRVHTGEKPYRCPWCDYRSNCAENIRKHILHTGKHEGVKMYNCPKCDYGTNVPVEFRNHLKELHLDIENPDLAYLHAGIVSKSFECRLKGQGANFVKTTSPFTAVATPEPSPVKEKIIRNTRKQTHSTEQIQQVIIIQGFSDDYDGDFTIDTSVEETAAATLQTLAMAGQVARVVHITEDGQVIATDQGAHMDTIIPGNILREQLPDGSTRVVVVEGPVGDTDVAESVSIETVTDSSGNVVQQVMSQGIIDASQTMHTADSSSALDALLCAVTELGNAEDANNEHNRADGRMEDSLVRISSHQESTDPSEEEIQMFHEIQEDQQGIEPMEVVRQVMQSSSILTSHEPTQVAFKKMVHGVLQFAVCGSAAADQLINEGVTQVILNEEGTVHMVSTEGPRIIMHNTDGHTLSIPEQHMDFVESDGEISQIIVTEELAQAMAQNAGGSFPEGTTHYFVTEMPQEDVQKETTMYSHTVIEAEESENIMHEETTLSADISSNDTAQELTSMVVYTECSSQDMTESNQTESIEDQPET
ncbi:zinc finger protein 407 [Discoglossus pictus]